MFINLYQATNLIGGGSAVPGADFRGRMVNVDLREHREIVHITLDKSDVIHALVIDKVRRRRRRGGAEAGGLGNGRGAAGQKTAGEAGAPMPAPRRLMCCRLTMKYVVPAKEPIALFDSAIAVDRQARRHAGRDRRAHQHAGLGDRAGQQGHRRTNRCRPGQRLLVPQIVFSAANSATAGAMKPVLR